MIDEILNNIQGRITGAFSSLLSSFNFVFDPLYKWYLYGFIGFVITGVIGYFLPFKWVRAGLGAALVLGGAYIAGGREMHNELKAQLKSRKHK
jgi:hypothetical protein